MTTPEDVAAREITVFNDRVRIDVLTRAPGLDFEDAWGRREVMSYRGVDLYVLSRADLVASKIAAGRPRDLEDVRALTLPG